MVASIGNAAITQSEVETEYRFEMLLDGRIERTPPDAETVARVRDRLLAQKLLEEEAAAQGTAAADSPGRAAEGLDNIRQKLGGPEAWASALRSLGMDEHQVEARLAAQQELLRRIEQRFRPLAWPERAEIESYYRDTFVPEFTRQSQSATPPLDEVESKIRDVLVEKKINELLEKWLVEMKSSRRVKVHDF